jgi:hypothetical protein
MAKDKCYILWHHKVETEAEAIEGAIAAGRYDQTTQEAVIIVSQVPMKTQYNLNQKWTSELPEAARKPSVVEEIMAEVHMTPKYDGPAGPVPEPKPERRTKIHYPDGLVPY